MNCEINNTTNHLIENNQIIELVKKFSEKFNLPNKDLSIAIVSDEDISALNKQYRDKEGPTDILSFEGDENMFGELLVDLDQIKRQEKFYSDDPNTELLFILTHGLLHLVGYEDDREEDRLKMISEGKELLDYFLAK